MAAAVARPAVVTARQTRNFRAAIGSEARVMQKYQPCQRRGDHFGAHIMAAAMLLLFTTAIMPLTAEAHLSPGTVNLVVRGRHTQMQSKAAIPGVHAADLLDGGDDIADIMAACTIRFGGAEVVRGSNGWHHVVIKTGKACDDIVRSLQQDGFEVEQDDMNEVDMVSGPFSALGVGDSIDTRTVHRRRLAQKNTTKTPTIGHPENGWLDQQRTCPDGAYINMWHVTKAYHIFSGNEYIETLQGFCSDGTPLQRMGGLIGSDFSSRYESMLQNGFTGVRIGFAVIDSGHAASRFGTIQSNASVAYEEVLACPSDMLINGYGGSSGWYIDSIYFACVRQAAAANIPRSQACDKEDLVLQCPPETKIGGIKSSFYGRTSNEKCPRYVLTFNCSADELLLSQLLEQRCKERNSCRVSEAEVLEVVGDPCIGTPKYREVVYACVGGPNSSTDAAVLNDPWWYDIADALWSIKAPQAWDIYAAKGGAEVTVCVIESMDISHEDLQGNMHPKLSYNPITGNEGLPITGGDEYGTYLAGESGIGKLCDACSD